MPDITGNWTYNPAAAAANYYHESLEANRELFSQNHEVRLIAYADGVDWLSASEENIHIFVGREKGIWSYIGYLFRKYLSNNWIEVELSRTEFGKKQTLTVLIDKANMTYPTYPGNTEVYRKKAIESIFSFVLAPPAKEDFIRQVREYNKLHAKQAWIDTVSKKWWLSKEIRGQFQSALGLAFDSGDESKKTAYVGKMNSFCEWYKENQSVRIEGESCLQDEFHKKFAEKLAAVEAQLNQLPEELSEARKEILEEFTVKASEEFLGRFRELPREQQTKENFERSARNIYLYLISKLVFKNAEMVTQRLNVSWGIIMALLPRAAKPT